MYPKIYLNTFCIYRFCLGININSKIIKITLVKHYLLEKIHLKYLQPVITQYFVSYKSEIWA